MLYADIAAQERLVPTGGSDFHGANKPDIRLGVGDGSIELGYETWEALRARCAARSTSENRFGIFSTQSSTVTRAKGVLPQGQKGSERDPT